MTAEGSFYFEIAVGKERKIMRQAEIDRINELARKARETGLNEDEKNEQQRLRAEYVQSFKRSLVTQLENTYIVDEKGNKNKVTKKH